MGLTRSAHRELSRQFHDREVSKTYTAIGYGKPDQNSGTIELPLIGDWPNRPKQKVDFETGKKATTHWIVDETFTPPITDTINTTTTSIITETNTRFLLTPITGRSHQLRVHLLELGHPILGDRLYSPDSVIALSPRLLLHATDLRLTHPTSGEEMHFNCPSPF